MDYVGVRKIEELLGFLNGELGERLAPTKVQTSERDKDIVIGTAHVCWDVADMIDFLVFLQVGGPALGVKIEVLDGRELVLLGAHECHEYILC